MYTSNDYKSDQYVRWCPGCGDHALLNSIQKAMAELSVAPEDIAVVSGIGCSSRTPYYMNTYGMHTIHGRASAVATGLKTANPRMQVWQVTGDGDALAIGGNHFIHAVRRNVNLNIILMNNHIYGMTKGQYSPTSPRGFVCKSSPYGTVEDPFRPAELTFGARGTFFARTLDVDVANSVKVFVAAAQHKGTSVVEAFTNCVVYTDGAHSALASKDLRAENAIYLEHGKPMIFGKDNDKGIMQDGFSLKVVKLGENGVTEKDLLVHDAHCVDGTLHLKLALMEGPDFPIALGVIRAVAAPVYDEEVEKQIEDVKAKNPARNFHDLMMQQDVWEIK